MQGNEAKNSACVTIESLKTSELEYCPSAELDWLATPKPVPLWRKILNKLTIWFRSL